MSTQYTQPPPQYGAVPSSSKKQADHDPLIPSEESDDAAFEEDFKIGVTVSQSSVEVRQAFIRKVYSMLFIMLSGTTIMSAVMRTQGVQSWVQANSWMMWLCIGGSFASLLGVMWKRHSHPANLVLLGTFTAFEAVTVGTVVSFYDQVIVLKALILTIFVFVGLTLFTFQTKYDFSSWGSGLLTVLMVFFGMGIVGIFFPWGRTADLIYSGLGVLLFSGYILYDTSMLLNRLSPDEWVLAVVSLYLDVINLFLYILRLLNDMQDN